MVREKIGVDDMSFQDLQAEADGLRQRINRFRTSLGRFFVDKQEIIDRAVYAVQRAASYCSDIEFSPEDASRTELDFLCQVIEAAMRCACCTTSCSRARAASGSISGRLRSVSTAVGRIHCVETFARAIGRSSSRSPCRRATTRWR